MEQTLFLFGWVFIGLAGIGGFLLMYFIHNGAELSDCMLERLTGWYCPGCGGTRAFLALIRGNIVLSLWYHPLVIYFTLIFGAFMISQTYAFMTKYRKTQGVRFHNWYLYGALIIVVANCIIKNLLRQVWNISLE
ncbi:MAG: DUF2752 domain-containing protein [Lachnospiraceae bacterium]|nr:DUF2752 domain-containing protein [Lachnospiraceae bacterium]